MKTTQHNGFPSFSLPLISERMNIAMMSIAILLAHLFALPAVAQQVDTASRPSFSLIFMEGQFDSGKITQSYFNPTISSLAERADIDLVKSVNLREMGIRSDSLFQGSRSEEIFKTGSIGWAQTNNIGQEIISSLFQIDADFVWSNEKLQQRARYAQTLREAAVDVESMRGGVNSARDNALEHLTRSYVWVLLPKREVSTVNYKDSKGRNKTRTSVVTNVHATLLRLDLDSKAEVISTLGSMYCESGCSDRETKKNAFENLEMPFEALWTGVVSPDVDDDTQLESVLQLLIDEAIEAVPDLKQRSYVVDDNPIRALIGKKEGVKRGRRYEVVRQVERNGERLQNRRGFVRAKSVVDNRLNATATDSLGGEYVVEFDPSVFKQIHGRNINPMDVLVEDPDLGISVYGGYQAGAYTSFGLDIHYSKLGIVPVLSGEMFYEDSDPLRDAFGTYWSRWLTMRGGIGGGMELYMMRGNLRITPTAVLYYQYSTPVDPENDNEDNAYMDAFSYRVGSFATLQLAPSFGFFAGIHLSGLLGDAALSDDDGEIETFVWEDIFDKGIGTQVSGGLKLSF